MLKIFILFHLLHFTGSAVGQSWDFAKNGDDWPSIFPACAQNQQSPINLRTSQNSNPFPTIYQTNEFQKTYINIQQANITWDSNYTIKLLVEGTSVQPKTQYFQSMYMQNNLFSDLQFNANQFHFHQESEHTIDGQRFDFEMHVVHFPNQTLNGNIASAFGVIFDRKNYDQSISQSKIDLIDKFFDSLMIKNSASYTVQDVPFGQLMNILDQNKRWVYKGSLTTPPCSKTVIFNILSTVYPIKQRHLDLFTATLSQAQNLTTFGSYRNIQPLNTHDPVYITNVIPGSEPMRPEVIAVIILSIIIGLLIGVLGFIIFSKQRRLDKIDIKIEYEQDQEKFQSNKKLISVETPQKENLQSSQIELNQVQCGPESVEQPLAIN